MNGTILVGMTDSPAARAAAEWAAQRASDRGDRLVLMSVVGGALGVVGEGAVLDDALAVTRGHLERMAEELGAAEVRVTRGKPVEQLLAASENADLLVIGSDYRGTGSRVARGPHGVRIAAAASCPVVVVPQSDLSGRSGVVVGVDGSDLSEAAIRFAAAEADRQGEPLIAVTAWMPVTAPLGVITYPDDYRENAQHLAEEAMGLSLAGLAQDYPDLEVRRIVEAADPAALVNRVSAEARLAVVGSRGRGAVARFLLGSTSHDVLLTLATATAVVR
ncbi:universal stress protein [Microbacterium lushaniae]|uniref:Universal stress protein n=2 Tax=Microbacterium lushaniae TaxID=2614639 RepID=A0A5J6L274_9MICO|nr:universal stress protein [Microbacterium lushaniae]QEW02570.1 universal stress protein [Microbacterium lushaniae]